MQGLADEYGVTVGTVHGILKRNNVPSKSRAPRNRVEEILEREESICRSYQRNFEVTLKDVAVEHDVSTATVGSVLKKYGIEARQSRPSWRKGIRAFNPTPEQEEEICDLYSEDIANSTTNLAKLYGVHSSDIAQVLKKYEVATRAAGWNLADRGPAPCVVEAAELWADGKSSKAIASRMGVDRFQAMIYILKSSSPQDRRLRRMVRVVLRDSVGAVEYSRWKVAKGLRQNLVRGRCDICHAQGKLHVDHCHTSGIIRGLLCNSCNLGIGHLKDDITVLRSATNYLRR